MWVGKEREAEAAGETGLVKVLGNVAGVQR